MAKNKIISPQTIISSNTPLEFFANENKINSSLDLQLTKIDGTFPKILDKKVHDFSLVQVGKRRKMESSDTLIIRCQQDFELYHQLNPINVKMDNDKFISSMKKYKKPLYKFTATALLFPASIVNDTNQMFLTCCKLNKAKVALINSKFLNILWVINLNLSKWSKIKG